MDKINRFPKQNRIHTEAGEWLAKLDRGLTADEHVMLQHWLVESKENREVLFNMIELWDEIIFLCRLSILFPDATEPVH